MNHLAEKFFGSVVRLPNAMGAANERSGSCTLAKVQNVASGFQNRQHLRNFGFLLLPRLRSLTSKQADFMEVAASSSLKKTLHFPTNYFRQNLIVF